MILKNNHKITGVLHQQSSEKHYHLRRYLPSPHLANLIEQFWFVNWNLPLGKTHIQQNLPDPNFHLVINRHSLKIMAPISKKHSYKMQGKGHITGVKFRVGALKQYLSSPISSYIDAELSTADVFNINSLLMLKNLENTYSDRGKIKIIEKLLQPYSSALSLTPTAKSLARANKLILLIKSTPEITTVEYLSQHTHISVRAIQRCFKEFIGFTPKWIIRKYRLHQALEALKNEQICMADIAMQLDYTDQSHLIRDFKEIIGVTPAAYLAQK